MAKLHPISGTGIETRIADVIFVHGLGGDAFKTWRYGDDQSTSWPHWLGDEFKNVGVWSLGYAASPSKWTRFLKMFSKERSDEGYSMSLPNRSGQVLNLLCLSYSFDSAAVSGQGRGQERGNCRLGWFWT